MKITYCEDWDLTGGAPVGVMSSERARKRHARGKAYTVVVESDQSLKYVQVVLEAQGVQVVFLDEFGRDYLVYQFDEVEPGRTFLRFVSERDYDRPGRFDYSRERPKVIRETTTKFHPEGRVEIWIHDLRTDEEQHGEKEQDVSMCGEPTPEFGDYASISRLER